MNSLETSPIDRRSAPVQAAIEHAFDEGILSTIGNTPLIRLRRSVSNLPFRVFAKLEGFNPGGSIKDRAAACMIAGALSRNEITANTTIVESSSGNLGIGLAQICCCLGLQFICVIDPKTTAQNVALLRAYGARLEMVDRPDLATGDFLAARLNRVTELVKALPDAYWPNQYANLDNAKAHHATMAEIVSRLGGHVDYILCPTSSCGTIRGCAEYVKTNGLPTRVWAVDAVGSVIFGLPAGKRLLPGHGSARRPELLKADLIDRYLHVTDLDCVKGCRRLLREEALLVGGSSGGVLVAVHAAADAIPRDATCVLIFPDRGERYLDTIFSDQWIREHFDEVFDLVTAGSDAASSKNVRSTVENRRSIRGKPIQ